MVDLIRLMRGIRNKMSESANKFYKMWEYTDDELIEELSRPRRNIVVGNLDEDIYLIKIALVRLLTRPEEEDNNNSK